MDVGIENPCSEYEEDQEHGAEVTPTSAEPAGKKKKKKKKKLRNNSSKAEAIGIIASLSVQEISYKIFFSASERVNGWWESYQQAFQNELEWMEKAGQMTSRKMKLAAPQMLPLVFSDEAGSELTRRSYFATVGNNGIIPIQAAETIMAGDMPLDEGLICAYATIDEHPSTSGVCHLRMLLVSPLFQRQGVGLAMLQHIVNCDRFHSRHIGLKFARCNNYEKFYEKVGFSVIGTDEFYVYMALRR